MSKRTNRCISKIQPFFSLLEHMIQLNPADKISRYVPQKKNPQFGLGRLPNLKQRKFLIFIFLHSTFQSLTSEQCFPHVEYSGTCQMAEQIPHDNALVGMQDFFPRLLDYKKHK